MAVLNRHRDRIPDDAVNIMRPSKWGNPFRIGARMTREQAIEAYRVNLWNRILSGEISLEDLDDLFVVDLVCCCTPKPCHGHVLERAAAWANDVLHGMK